MTDPLARIVLAEDDDDDFLLVQRALRGARVSNELHRVRDGEELLDYLRSRGDYESRPVPAGPLLVLLDLNMPRMDGREALKAIKSDPVLRGIPVVIFTTSAREEDVRDAYAGGAASYLRKPDRLRDFQKLIQLIDQYWLRTARLPGAEVRV